ncbi:MAG: hypothetical protein R3B09_29360 [Nannocystaceae bacterium]
MPKMPHEALVRLVQNAPSMIPRLIWPERQVRSSIHLGPAEITDLHLAEYRADAVLLLGENSRRPDKAIVVEAQGEIDHDKEWTWPFYLSGLRVRLRCPTILVVIAMDREVERWARQQIDLGDGCCTMRPIVIGPGDVPIITDQDVARAAPELAVLSVAAHAAEPPGEDIARVALNATQGLDRDRGIFYADFVFAFLKEFAPDLLEKFMATADHKFYSDFARKYYADGKAEGEAKGRTEGIAEALITLLEQRGFGVDDAERRRILECGDLDQLQSWLARVLTAKSLAEVFGD